MSGRQLPGLTTVVIVSYQSAATLLRCVDSVLASDAPVQIVVVDNASRDDGVALVRERATTEPRISVIANRDNRGFAAACNQGAAAAQGAALFLLNPDAFVPTDAVGRLHQYLSAQDDTGLLGCTVVDETGYPHGPQRRREPTPWRALMTLLGLARFERRWPILAGVEELQSNEQGNNGTGVEAPVTDAVNGAAMFVRSDLYRALGGMDEGFRLHAEDLDLCRRVREAGFAVRQFVDVCVTHLGGVSSRSRPLWVEWQKSRSLWRYFRKHSSASPWPIRALVAAGLALRFALKLPVLLARSLLRRRRH